MKVILINPTNKTIAAHELQDGSLESLYIAMGCDIVQAIPLGAGYNLWVDEEGLLQPSDFFVVHHNGVAQNLLSGKAVIAKGSGALRAVPDGFNPEHVQSFIAFQLDENKEKIRLLAREILEDCGIVNSAEELCAKHEAHALKMQTAMKLCWK